MPGVPILIERAVCPTDDVRRLVGALDHELMQEYPPEQRHGLSLAAIFQPHIRFFIARMDGVAVGCGGLALLTGFAEVKRMYVTPAVRAGGVADAILSTLGQTALDEGRQLLKLETGTRQLRAIAFYRRRGFVPCPSFEPYASMPADNVATSVFFEKYL